MPDEMKNNVAQVSAWFASIIGIFSLEIWIAIAGLVISAILALTNYRSRKLQDRLLLEQNERDKELHELQAERLRHGLNIAPSVDHSGQGAA